MNNYQQRKNKREKVCRQSESEDVSCKNCKFFKKLNASSFYCPIHVIYVRTTDVCDMFAEKPKPALKPTIADVLAKAKQSKNPRLAYIEALKQGGYRV